MRLVQKMASLPGVITPLAVLELAQSRQQAYNAISYAERTGAIERVARGQYTAVASD